MTYNNPSEFVSMIHLGSSNIICYYYIIFHSLFRYSNLVIIYGAFALHIEMNLQKNFKISYLSLCLDSLQCSASEPPFPPYSLGRHSFGICSWSDVQSSPWIWIWNIYMDRQACLLKCDFEYSHVLFWRIVKCVFLGNPHSMQ